MKKIIKKPWGYYQVIYKAKNYLVKKIFVNPKSKLSLQSHKYRSEHWIIAEGKAEVTVNNKVLEVEVQNAYPISMGGIDLSHANGEEIIEFTVTFAYDQWLYKAIVE